MKPRGFRPNSDESNSNRLSTKLSVAWSKPNSKPNNDMLQARFEQLLRQNCDVAGVVRRRKLTAQQGAPKAYLDDLAAHADFVISGLGD